MDKYGYVRRDTSNDDFNHVTTGKEEVPFCYNLLPQVVIQHDAGIGIFIPLQDADGSPGTTGVHKADVSRKPCPDCDYPIIIIFDEQDSNHWIHHM